MSEDERSCREGTNINLEGVTFSRVLSQTDLTQSVTLRRGTVTCDGGTFVVHSVSLPDSDWRASAADGRKKCSYFDDRKTTRAALLDILCSFLSRCLADEPAITFKPP